MNNQTARKEYYSNDIIDEAASYLSTITNSPKLESEILLADLLKKDRLDFYKRNISIDKKTTLTIKFHKRRLTEDQNLFVREGDFVKYGTIFYEIVKTNEPKQLYGQIDSKFEIIAECIRSRDGLFNGE